MATAIEIGKFLLANYAQLLAALLAFLAAALGIALLIPGPQPDKFLQGCVDFLTKFSRKPDDTKKE